MAAAGNGGVNGVARVEGAGIEAHVMADVIEAGEEDQLGGS